MTYLAITLTIVFTTIYLALFSKIKEKKQEQRQLAISHEHIEKLKSQGNKVLRLYLRKAAYDSLKKESHQTKELPLYLNSETTESHNHA